MIVETELTDDALDDLTEDEGDDEPSAMVIATIGTDDGMRWSGAVHRAGENEMTPEQYAEALVSAAYGAARTHGPATARALERWLAVPHELEVTGGGA